MYSDPVSHIRNFSIIAHIDHGKSTLADRLLEKTGALSERERKEQFLDSMDIERERRITVKASAREIPPPPGDPRKPLAALIFDSWFDPYHGAVILCRIFDGRVRKGTRIRMMSTGRDFEVSRVGVFAPRSLEVDELSAGGVG